MGSMANVEKNDRANTGFSDGSYPVATQAQAMSAIKLRGHSKKHSSQSVLSHVAAAAKKNGWTSVMAAVKRAKIEDERGS